MRLLMLIGVAALLAGCGGMKQASTTTTTAAVVPATTTASTAPAPSPSPLQAEAKAAATGDIPDNQVFLRYVDTSAGYSLKYPEGWAQQGAGATVTIRDKNNIVRVVVKPGGAVTSAQARTDLAGVAGATVVGAPRSMSVGGKHVVKVVYTTESSANPVTGKRVLLVVDRYYLSHAGKRAVVDLGTPQGVDNVDAYRLMIESFTWK
jgi:hypothetical protein